MSELQDAKCLRGNIIEDIILKDAVKCLSL